MYGKPFNNTLAVTEIKSILHLVFFFYLITIITNYKLSKSDRIFSELGRQNYINIEAFQHKTLLQY